MQIPHALDNKSNIFRLALLDLRHEWILTACMVLAVAAILAPLLILLGLKHGTITTLRDRLVEDPVNREIRPARTLQLSQRWFDEFNQRPEVEFIIPTILRGSSVVRVSKPNSSETTIFDLVPTAPYDPLIIQNQGVVPRSGECVLSYSAAEELGGVKVGDFLIAEITRTRNRQRESEKIRLEVVSVLSPRADALARIYAPFQLVNDVEAYREGRAVPKRGWEGGIALPPLSYDGVWLLTPEPLNPLEETRLTINTGFANFKTLSPQIFAEEFGFSIPETYSVYQLSAVASVVLATNIKAIKNKLRGKSAVLIPYVTGVEIRQSSEESLKTVGISLSNSQMQDLGLPTLPWGPFDPDAEFDKLGQILLPSTLANSRLLILHTSTLNNEVLTFRLKTVGDSFGEQAIVPVELLGVLRTALDNKIIFDERQGNFLLGKSGYRGFRLYAKSIDDVPDLYRTFIEQEIDVITKVHEIEKVKILDRGLTSIFWLVAIVGIIGGMAALIASLYASVERKKRDISVLRLMGLSRFEVFRFPIYQAFSMAVMSVIVAIAVYSLLAAIINFVFSADLQLGQKICTLPNVYFLYTLVITSIIAVLSSLLAAWKTTAIDPAEALREE